MSEAPPPSFDYIFGFGSIINTETHAPWLQSSTAASTSTTDATSEATPPSSSLPGLRATLKATFGYRRGWIFRSSTGFTALGIQKAAHPDTANADSSSLHPATNINGVLFRIPHAMLASFDRREVGYDRIPIELKHLELHSEDCLDDPATTTVTTATGTSCTKNQNHHQIQISDLVNATTNIWVYVPQTCAIANEDHPILQSYVDTVLQGCLEWGGVDMAEQFVVTTDSWSRYFLNDTPSSRRPWLFRKQYATIDCILRQYAHLTQLDHRRHPEEFATASLQLSKWLRGTWSVPRRSASFIGRDSELGQMHARLTSQTAGGTIAKLSVVGMAGVGKTQLSTEYCYRYFPAYYGLVIWLAANSSESVAAGYRQLMVDTTTTTASLSSSSSSSSMLASTVVKDMDTDEVVAEVKARLFRSKVPWLLVFDNLEDMSLLDKFVPHGGNGHVLVTTRIMVQQPEERHDHDDLFYNNSGSSVPATTTTSSSSTMMLGCFSPSESVELLCRSAGQQNMTGPANIKAAHELADQLGHLPLAVGMAAAYMSRCDVDCSEYLARWYAGCSKLGPARMMSGEFLGHQAVHSSLSLSLYAIQQENVQAWQALRLLGWLGPDQITKPLLRSLLAAKLKAQLVLEHQEQLAKARSQAIHTVLQCSLWTGIAALCCSLALVGRQNGQGPLGRKAQVRIGLASASLSFMAAGANVTLRTRERLKRRSHAASTDLDFCATGPPRRNASGDVFEQTDQIWTILKSYSLLVVKEGKGSMHRLLAHSLRVSQDEQERQHNLEICVQVVRQIWGFKPEQVDTWQASANVLEHVKAVISHVQEQQLTTLRLETAILSRQAGVFTAMALNRFKEAQFSLEQSLSILESGLDRASNPVAQARAATLHELGRVFRYEEDYQRAEESLRNALAIRTELKDLTARQEAVAATLHELGVLEVKKHNLDAAASFLQQALDLRRRLELEAPSSEIEAECASTLHQLAAVHVARKSPSLDEAENLLKEALGLNMQIGQRAATLKQLARVAIRRGEFDTAEKSLAQALELYIELYGENTFHINLASVKFQQGALAFQREQLEQAWLHFSECLRARRHVYAYSQGNHLEVSTVLHELGCVALAQGRGSKALEMLTAEKHILDQLSETASHQQHQYERIYQARLTNLTWLRKCAKDGGDEDEARRIIAQRSDLKRHHKLINHCSNNNHPDNASLQREAVSCRSIVREFALGPSSFSSTKAADNRSTGHDSSSSAASESSRHKVLVALANLERELSKAAPCPLKEAAFLFHKSISQCFFATNSDAYTRFNDEEQRRLTILKACDDLRDMLRHHGLRVNDATQANKKALIL